MRTLLVASCLASLVVGVLVSCSSSGARGASQLGTMAAEIVGRDVDGEAFKLSDYRGKVVVLDFWGHW